VLWSTAAVLATGLVLAVLGSGTAVLLAAGARLRDAASAAPAVGTGVVALTAVAAGGLGLPWGVLPVVVGTVACAAAAAVLAGRVRRRGPVTAPPVAEPSPAPVAPRTARLTTAAAVLVGSLLSLVPLAVAMGRPDRVQNAWDALFHLAAVDLLRTGATVDLRAVSDLASPVDPVTYPYAWHVVAALAPGGVDPLTAVNVAALVPVVVFGVGGMAALGRSLFPTTPHVGPVTAVLSAAALGAPLAIAIQPGLIPNAYGLALVPGVLAWIVRSERVTTAALVPAALAVAGIGLSHPGALLGLALLAAPWVAARAARWLLEPGIRSETGQRRLLVLSGAVLCAVLAVVLVVGSGTGAAVGGTRVKDPLTAGEVARRLLTGDLGEWPAQPLVVVALAVVGTVVLVVRRQQPTLLAATLLTVAAYVSAASPWPHVSSWTALWYTETRRIAPLVGLTATVVAAYGLVAVARWVRDGARRRLPGAVPHVLATSCAVALIAVCVVTGVRATHGVASDAFSQDVVEDAPPLSRTPYLTVGEEEMVARLGDVLGPEDLVLGSSFSGAGHLAVLAGTRAVVPYHMTPLGDDAALVDARAGDLGRDPAVCAAVRRIGATHLYVDPHPLHSTYWTREHATGFTTPPGPATRLVDRGGSASLHSLDGCYPAGPPSETTPSRDRAQVEHPGG